MTGDWRRRWAVGEHSEPQPPDFPSLSPDPLVVVETIFRLLSTSACFNWPAAKGQRGSLAFL